MKEIRMYVTRSGKTPFREWFESLDRQLQFRIDRYVDRLRSDSAKSNIKSLGEGVFELRIHFGPGYRLYFGEDQKTIIVLLVGGTKRRQSEDIELAKTYWRTYAQKN